jgi:hypothetical protein
MRLLASSEVPVTQLLAPRPTSIWTPLISNGSTSTQQPIELPEGSMKNRLLKELKELDLAMARLRDRRVDVTNMIETLATLTALEPSIGNRIDNVLAENQPM